MKTGTKARRITSVLLTILLIPALMLGCTKPVEETPPPPEPQAQEETPVVPEDTTVSIVDITGRTVTLPKPAERVIGTHNPTMNIAIILGGGGKYIAGFGNKNMAGNLYSYVYPELDGVVQIGKGREINIESCVEVKADLVILPERFADLVDQFEEAGIPAAVILPNHESYESIKESIRLLGILLGEEERASAIISYYDEKISSVKALAAQAPDSPKVMFTGASSQLSVANGLMLQSVMIETVGATNVAKDVDGGGDFIEVSLEEIVGWDPDVIFIPAYASYSVEDILNDPAWSSISAVQNGKVYQFPSLLEPWDYPTPSTVMGLEWMLSSLYPQLISPDQVLADANTYYDMVYGQTFTAEQLGIK